MNTPHPSLRLFVDTFRDFYSSLFQATFKVTNDMTLAYIGEKQNSRVGIQTIGSDLFNAVLHQCITDGQYSQLLYTDAPMSFHHELDPENSFDFSYYFSEVSINHLYSQIPHEILTQDPDVVKIRIVAKMYSLFVHEIRHELQATHPDLQYLVLADVQDMIDAQAFETLSNALKIQLQGYIHRFGNDEQLLKSEEDAYIVEMIAYFHLFQSNIVVKDEYPTLKEILYSKNKHLIS